jgi:hypothetical protein
MVDTGTAKRAELLIRLPLHLRLREERLDVAVEDLDFLGQDSVACSLA